MMGSLPQRRLRLKPKYRRRDWKGFHRGTAFRDYANTSERAERRHVKAVLAQHIEPEVAPYRTRHDSLFCMS